MSSRELTLAVATLLVPDSWLEAADGGARPDATWSGSADAPQAIRCVAGELVATFRRSPFGVELESLQDATTHAILATNTAPLFRLIVRHVSSQEERTLAAYREEPSPTGLYVGVHDPWGGTKHLEFKSTPATRTVQLGVEVPAADLTLVANDVVFDGEVVWQLLRGDWVGFQWYNWQEIPFDNDYPHYFPTQAGFAQGVAEPQSAGVHVNWCSASRSAGSSRPSPKKRKTASSFRR